MAGLGAAIEIRARALGDIELLGRYENTLVYRSAPQVKGARTRRRNRAAAQAQLEAAAQAQPKPETKPKAKPDRDDNA